MYYFLILIYFEGINFAWRWFYPLQYQHACNEVVKGSISFYWFFFLGKIIVNLLSSSVNMLELQAKNIASEYANQNWRSMKFVDILVVLVKHA